MPVSIIEAGASGLPVVATPRGNEHDVPEMAEAMLRLLDQPALAARLGQAARDHVAAHFSMERSLALLWSIIDRCMAGRQPMPASPGTAAEFS